ncbi:MAG: hypothetical protein IJU12_02855 [Clostridia bacterium]|nr:hypothetical protein [Clostridia bacterium]
MSIGHGLYTCDLRSPKGKKLLEDMRKYDVTLEFQITSNVRLNNLSHLDRHPLRQYLQAGVRCVQGTDGGALYGTNSIDEELSLEKLLGLTFEELCRMRQAEADILEESLRVFDRKMAAFRADCPVGDIELYYAHSLENAEQPSRELWQGGGRISAEDALKEQLTALPEGVFPIILCGGSFNSSRRRAAVKAEDRAFLDDLLAQADPGKVCFVVGHTLTGQEGYLVRHALPRFRVFAIVPTLITRAERARLQEAGVGVLVSIDSSGMGLYKSFAYEIFKRMPAALLAFDGNSAALNLIQEARNGRQKCRIYINPHSRGLAAKARMLEGYVEKLGDAGETLRQLGCLK